MRRSADRSGFPAVTIDATALRDNLAVVRRLAPRSRIVAVVKANAYGHGLVPVARVFAGADPHGAGDEAGQGVGHEVDPGVGQGVDRSAGQGAGRGVTQDVTLGVARLEEALALREAGIAAPILLLEGVFSAAQLQCAARHRVEIVVHSGEQIHMLEQFTGAYRFTAWLKLDTGMNRLGFRVGELAAARTRLSGCAAVAGMRLMTHLACADEPDSALTRAQIETFGAVVDALGGDALGLDEPGAGAPGAGASRLERSIANSAGLIAWPQTRLEWVRPGLMLYGLSPLAGRSAATLGLRPAMTLSTRLIALHRLAAGETVGYGAIWRAPQPVSIGIAAIGYGDGYPRGMRNGAPVRVDGHEARIVGRVSMDMCAIDVTSVPGVHIGSAVTLWGEGLPAEQVAPHADTITYELVCRITERVKRQWQGI
ncbi:alanine racemase [Steroidobacter denitrificans]|uniref:Alanine racemase n=1 Tax=Steroidobacter denitrificans TaxID=465721 RepID=A0A127F7G2_STEDE|nr:alanine racemase [Steroidobacter denitrificans]AMN46392.1 alanine racemase [Steroidobacter denitrificans]